MSKNYISDVSHWFRWMEKFSYICMTIRNVETYNEWRYLKSEYQAGQFHHYGSQTGSEWATPLQVSER